MALLEVKNLSISFGGLRAVDEFNVKIEKGQLYGLIGPNGAGKTTVFNLLTGVYKPTSGAILLDGVNITGKKTIDINRCGIARTFQNIRLFKELSVLDNVKVGLHNQMKYSTAEGVLRLPRFFSTEKKMDEKAMELLKVFGLENEASTLADNLPYGKQRKLEIARALATNPKLLLLDEPTSHLDTYAQVALENAISEYQGAVLMVSHDFYSIVNTMDYVLYVEEKTIRKMRVRSFRKMIYKDYFEQEYLELELKKKELEAKYGPKKAAAIWRYAGHVLQKLEATEPDADKNSRTR